MEVQGEIGRREAHEVAGAAARLEDGGGLVALADAGLAQRVVDGADDGRRRVEGGEDGMALGRELVLAQQLPEPVADLTPLALGLLGEGLLRAAPARIGLHGGDLGGGGAASLLGGGKRLQCGQVLPCAGDGAAGALRVNAGDRVDGRRVAGGLVDRRRGLGPGVTYMASMISLIAISVAIASAEFVFLMKLGRSLERSSGVAPHDFMQPGVSSLIRLRYAVSICSRYDSVSPDAFSSATFSGRLSSMNWYLMPRTPVYGCLRTAIFVSLPRCVGGRLARDLVYIRPRLGGFVNGILRVFSDDEQEVVCHGEKGELSFCL